MCYYIHYSLTSHFSLETKNLFDIYWFIAHFCRKKKIFVIHFAVHPIFLIFVIQITIDLRRGFIPFKDFLISLILKNIHLWKRELEVQ